MRKETIIKNIKHCDHYIESLKNAEHVKYYKLRKKELIKELNIKNYRLPREVIKVKSMRSPKKVALEFIDLYESKKLKLVDIAKSEKVNEGSLSKAIFRIRNSMK